MSEPSEGNSPTPNERPWLDSPWVWFALFAAMGIVALVAVSPKYAQRQGRLEQRYANRVRIQEQRQVQAMPGDATEPVRAAPTRMSEARATTSLVPIALALASVLAVTALLLWLRARRQVPVRPPDGS